MGRKCRHRRFHPLAGGNVSSLIPPERLDRRERLLKVWIAVEDVALVHDYGGHLGDAQAPGIHHVLVSLADLGGGFGGEALLKEGLCLSWVRRQMVRK